ncbi:hypothetical protein CTAYLR_010742 [Chrysophaeum taylorii]|uniref:U3 small nucleolar RNA-associated protein 11 n=1 Tax=Chrysophaeum taylorii TaxID=2483200 RepID=A0AAD7XHU6_9STRA|nr:hypothetical protein CTAYLR_010742 [Chrysophaeum taylorii]
MSSLRNAVKRRTHKERAQPSYRKHLGLLEKRKDYKERAENYHKKVDRLKILHRKAAERNPDEFYFEMTNQVAGKPIAREDAKMSHKAIVRLKEQDARLAAMRKVVDERKVDKLRANLHGTTKPPENEHTYFIDDPDAPVPEPKPTPTKGVKGAQKRMARAYARLDAAMQRKENSACAMERLAMEKKLMTAKGRKRKVQAADGSKPAIFKWKRQRKK